MDELVAAIEAELLKQPRQTAEQLTRRLSAAMKHSISVKQVEDLLRQHSKDFVVTPALWSVSPALIQQREREEIARQREQRRSELKRSRSQSTTRREPPKPTSEAGSSRSARPGKTVHGWENRWKEHPFWG
jgi:hypothetical protein